VKNYNEVPAQYSSLGHKRRTLARRYPFSQTSVGITTSQPAELPGPRVGIALRPSIDRSKRASRRSPGFDVPPERQRIKHVIYMVKDFQSTRIADASATC